MTMNPTTMKHYLARALTLCLIVAAGMPGIAMATQTQTLSDAEAVNPNSSSFRLIACDGPAGANTDNDPDYVPCDFNGLMRQAQRLITVMLVLGVLAAIVMFSYAGYLYVTGAQDKINHAKDIFKKVGLGFIIMLSAWFIVYQILAWFTDNEAFRALLGKP